MKFKRDQVVKEGADLGIILAAGERSFDVIWLGGSTSRYVCPYCERSRLVRPDGLVRKHGSCPGSLADHRGMPVSPFGRDLRAIVR